MRYLLGSGYFTKPEFDRSWDQRWAKTLIKAAGHYRPNETVIVSVGGSGYPDIFPEFVEAGWKKPQIITSSNNLGHGGMILSGEKDNELSGWSASILMLAMAAYNDGSDFIYYEHDVLAFGPIIEELYKQIGDKKIIFGDYRIMGQKAMPCANSLFLIKNDYLLAFIWDYLSLGSEKDKENMCEHKFHKLSELRPDKYARFSFGYDRGRPDGNLRDIKDHVYYFQHLTKEELDQLP